ncbi:hypothetical protein ACOSQ3_019875 [Xanthoceras sorbifolium]
MDHYGGFLVQKVPTLYSCIDHQRIRVDLMTNVRYKQGTLHLTRVCMELNTPFNSSIKCFHLATRMFTATSPNIDVFTSVKTKIRQNDN